MSFHTIPCPVSRSLARIYVTRRRCSYRRSQIPIRWRALARARNQGWNGIGAHGNEARDRKEFAVFARSSFRMERNGREKGRWIARPPNKRHKRKYRSPPATQRRERIVKGSPEGTRSSSGGRTLEISAESLSLSVASKSIREITRRISRNELFSGCPDFNDDRVAPPILGNTADTASCK